MIYIKTQNNEDLFVMSVHYIKVSPTSGSYIASTKDDAQGIVVNGVVYSVNTNKPISGVETATITPFEQWDTEIKNKYETLQCENAKASKIPQLVSACEMAINAGGSVELTDGSTENFTYTIEDQANISEMFNAVLMGAENYAYHANGGNCKMYNAQDIVKIYTTLATMKTAQLTYQNQLKQYVNSLTTAQEVSDVEYGQELTGQYLETYNSILAQSKLELEKILAKVTITLNA